MHEQIGSSAHRDDTHTRCDPYCATLAQLFSPYPEAGSSLG